MKRLNYYKVTEVIICPYCGSEQYNENGGCCGESSAHFETALSYQDEIYQLDEVELYKPIIDNIRYNLNPYIIRVKVKTLKRKLRRFLTDLYDNNYPVDSFILKLRKLTGFQWTKLDRLILEQLHDFPLYTKSPSQWAIIRKKSVKSMRDSWAKGELLGCNLVPKISDNE